VDDLKARAASPDQERRARLNQRLRRAFIEGAEEDSRRRLGRGLTAEELERVFWRYTGDVPERREKNALRSGPYDPAPAVSLDGPSATYLAVRICTIPNGTCGQVQTAHPPPIRQGGTEQGFHQRTVDTVASPMRWANGETDPASSLEDRPMKRAMGLVVAILLLGAVAAPVAQAESKAEGWPQWMGFVSDVAFPAGYFTDGQKVSYFMKAASVSGSFPDDVWGPVEFTVSKDAPLYAGYVWLRWNRVDALPGPQAVTVINPAQETKFLVGWGWGPGDYDTMAAAQADRADLQTFVSFDGLGGPWILAANGPIQHVNAMDGVYNWSKDVWHSVGAFHRS
jgi:hypothetical protein